MLVEFIEAPIFTRLLGTYLTDDEYRLLQAALSQDPEMGDVVPGTGGVRKLRWRDARRGQGRRGGLRVIYYYLRADEQIWMLTIYGKDEAKDLTVGERAALRRAVEAEKEGRRRARRADPRR